MRRKVVSFFITLGLAFFMSVNVVSAGAGEDGITSVETEEVDETLSDKGVLTEEIPSDDADENIGVASDGTGPYAIDTWWAAAKEEAKKADHVIGNDSEIGDIFGYNNLTYTTVHYYTIIQPGETIAVLPTVDLNNYGIQGGVSNFTFTIWQMEEAVVNTDYLTRSTPEQTTLTVLETKTMAIPYADRIIDHENDPALVDSDAITGVSYVSLYRNDTGLPIPKIPKAASKRRCIPVIPDISMFMRHGRPMWG